MPLTRSEAMAAAKKARNLGCFVKAVRLREKTAYRPEEWTVQYTSIQKPRQKRMREVGRYLKKERKKGAL